MYLSRIIQMTSQICDAAGSMDDNWSGAKKMAANLRVINGCLQVNNSAQNEIQNSKALENLFQTINNCYDTFADILSIGKEYKMMAGHELAAYASCVQKYNSTNDGKLKEANADLMEAVNMLKIYLDILKFNYGYGEPVKAQELSKSSGVLYSQPTQQTIFTSSAIFMGISDKGREITGAAHYMKNQLKKAGKIADNLQIISECLEIKGAQCYLQQQQEALKNLDDVIKDCYTTFSVILNATPGFSLESRAQCVQQYNIEDNRKLHKANVNLIEAMRMLTLGLNMMVLNNDICKDNLGNHEKWKALNAPTLKC